MLANYTGWSLSEISKMPIDEFILWIKDMHMLEKMQTNQYNTYERLN